MADDHISLKEYIGKLEKRIDKIDDFILKEQGLRYVTRAEHNKIVTDVENLQAFKENQKGKADQKDLSSVKLIAIIGILLSITGIIVGALI